MSRERRDLDSIADRVLSPDEARRYLDAPIDDAERENVQALARWFCRRYPTPIERLSYARRAYARWQRTRGLAGSGMGADGRSPKNIA